MIVLDSSFVIALLTPDIRAEFVEQIVSQRVADLHAPTLLSFEVAHVLTRKHRLGAISLAERDRAIRLLDQQLITLDKAPEGADMIRIVTLAVTEGLSGYDAAYLDLALRLGAELGTLDRDLANAGERCGLTVHHQ